MPFSYSEESATVSRVSPFAYGQRGEGWIIDQVVIINPTPMLDKTLVKGRHSVLAHSMTSLLPKVDCPVNMPKHKHTRHARTMYHRNSSKYRKRGLNFFQRRFTASQRTKPPLPAMKWWERTHLISMRQSFAFSENE